MLHAKTVGHNDHFSSSSLELVISTYYYFLGTMLLLEN